MKHVYNQVCVLAYDLNEPSGDPLDDCPRNDSPEEQYEQRMESALKYNEVLGSDPTSTYARLFKVDPADVEFFLTIREARTERIRQRIKENVEKYRRESELRTAKKSI